MELFRSLRGVFICSLYETWIHYLVSNGYYQWNIPGIFGSDIPLKQVSPVVLLLLGLIMFMWGDFHFYWTHRLLHLSPFYQMIHKYHHESFNPNPFSGLSMHWIESSIYFSSALIPGLIGCPFTLVRLLFKSLLVFPLEGHNGFGSWEIEASNNHYIHHSKFNWNYGSSPLWDHIMGTNFPLTGIKKNVNKDRMEESREQAALVGCSFSEDYSGPSVYTNKEK